MTAHRPLLAAAAFVLLLMHGFSAAQDSVRAPAILVATPELHGELYAASVLLVAPIGNRQHIGFILNRPTPLKLSEMFPEHEASRKVMQPIYLGGPVNLEVLFALVQRPGRPDSGGIKLANDLYLEIERAQVDRVIEAEHRRARFFAGVVVWQPGELDAEIRHDYWLVGNADASLVLRQSTAGMWEELVKRYRRNKNLITAGGI